MSTYGTKRAPIPTWYPEQITVAFCIWLQANFDRLMTEQESAK